MHIKVIPDECLVQTECCGDCPVSDVITNLRLAATIAQYPLELGFAFPKSDAIVSGVLVAGTRNVVYQVHCPRRGCANRGEISVVESNEQ